MNETDKSSKLKLSITTLTIKTLETKATPVSSVTREPGEPCTGCPDGYMSQVAAVAYF